MVAGDCTANHVDRSLSKKNKNKKRPPLEEQNAELNGIKNKKKKKKKKSKNEDELEKKQRPPLSPTVSIAVAGSIIDNAQSLELATLLAGQIARAAAIFRIDEVVVFDNKPVSTNYCDGTTDGGGDENESGARFLVMILKYLETPQYLRRRLFPMHNNLKFVGLLPPLDAPHHLRKHEWSPFREGVTLDGNFSKSKGTLVDVGLSKNVVVEEALEPGRRVTVAMGTDRSSDMDHVRHVVTSSTPREEMGLYWGYKVRYCASISGIVAGSPYEGGYDHIIGTSERGDKIKASELAIPNFQHLLIVFGGLRGLEESIEEDSNLKEKGVHDVFDSYFNTCPEQGSRTIRTEEAIFISLQYFQEPINRAKERFLSAMGLVEGE